MEKYILEIFAPNSADEVIKKIESKDPFINIAKGDIINTQLWKETDSKDDILRVLNVEHIIWEVDKRINHKLCIFTERSQNTPETRLENWEQFSYNS